MTPDPAEHPDDEADDTTGALDEETDPVDEADEESFPASDAGSSWAGGDDPSDS
jgi:hypothetical protein